jgi:predicted ATPase/DNA-binding SARP family transcriptional activator
MELRVLGPIELVDGGERHPAGSAKERLVLSFLAVEANRVVSTDRLIEALWGDRPPASAEGTLRTYVTHLRSHLAACEPHANTPKVEFRRPGYVLSISEDALDAARFEAGVGDGRAALADGRPLDALVAFNDALGRWLGSPFAEFADHDFARTEVARLEELRIVALENRAAASLELGDHDAASGPLAALVAAHPLRESLWRHWIVALYRSGRQAEALRAFQDVRRLLVEELGIEPGVELRALEQAVLLQDPALDWRPPSPPSPTTTGSVSASPLPISPTSFVGRSAELNDVVSRFDESRLTTLTGPGGVGKTRLALAAASRHPVPPDGIWLVELAPIASAELVGATVAAALGIRSEPGRSPTDALVDAIAERELLIVLDNCEHVLEGAAKLADMLLRDCRGVEILATSREPLAIDGEAVYLVPSLPVPEPDTGSTAGIAEFDAVRLFTERATRHQRKFVLDDTTAVAVASICRRLDGIPLAIELAAARLRSLSVSEIDDRLDDRFRLLTGGSRAALPRQQTLRGLIDWSYDLLNRHEQAVFERLSLFAGGWTLDAAEAVVVDADIERSTVLDIVASLVDKSLVQVEQARDATRYRLLETIREYAAGHLETRGPEEMRRLARAHRDHYLSLAETAAPHITRGDQAEWLDRLEADHENLGAALMQSVTDADSAEPGLRLATALGSYWATRGHAREVAGALEQLVARPDAREPTQLRVRTLNTLGLMHALRGDRAGSRASYEGALELAREIGSTTAAATALDGLGFAEFGRSDLSVVLPYFDEAYELALAGDDPHLTARVLNHRAMVLDERGDSETARAAYADALAIFETMGDQQKVSEVHIGLGYSQLGDGNLTIACDHFHSALTIARALHDDVALAFVLQNLAVATTLDLDFERGREYFSESLAAARRVSNRTAVAYAVLGLAFTSTGLGDFLHAATLHGAADNLFEHNNFRIEHIEADLRISDHCRLREVLGDEAFESAYARGRSFTENEAARAALEDRLATGQA